LIVEADLSAADEAVVVAPLPPNPVAGIAENGAAVTGATTPGATSTKSAPVPKQPRQVLSSPLFQP